jgi:hypothetical protein
MNGFESGRYSIYRLKGGMYNIYATDDNGITCVGVITRDVWGKRRPWTVHVDGWIVGEARTLREAKKVASEILGRPFNRQELDDIEENIRASVDALVEV